MRQRPASRERGELVKNSGEKSIAGERRTIGERVARVCCGSVLTRDFQRVLTTSRFLASYPLITLEAGLVNR